MSCWPSALQLPPVKSLEASQAQVTALCTNRNHRIPPSAPRALAGCLLASTGSTTGCADWLHTRHKGLLNHPVQIVCNPSSTYQHHHHQIMGGAIASTWCLRDTETYTVKTALARAASSPSLHDSQMPCTHPPGSASSLPAAWPCRSHLPAIPSGLAAATPSQAALCGHLSGRPRGPQPGGAAPAGAPEWRPPAQLSPDGR